MDTFSPRASAQEAAPVAKSPTKKDEPQAGCSPKSSHKIRHRKLLKPSIIKRICQLPKKAKFRKGSKKVLAKVMYTNSQFGREPIPCKESGCNSCVLAPPRPKAEVSRLLSKRSRPRSSSQMLAKIKRPCTECMAKDRSLRTDKAFKTLTDADELLMREHHCFVAEVDGQLYKLKDSERNLDLNVVSAEYEDLKALLVTLQQLGPREEPSSSSTERTPRPKAAISRLLGKRSRPRSSSRKLAKIKRPCTECMAKDRSLWTDKIFTTDTDELLMREHYCFVVEVDGQLYKLMDE